MSERGDRIIKALQNVVDFTNGDTTKCIVRKRKTEAQPIKEYTQNDIKALRNGNNISQRLFAEIMGVTPQAVEAWEAGKRKPTGTAKRLFQIMEQNPDLVESILIREEVQPRV
jgi:putative transcriptional regulator